MTDRTDNGRSEAAVDRRAVANAQGAVAVVRSSAGTVANELGAFYVGAADQVFDTERVGRDRRLTIVESAGLQNEQSHRLADALSVGQPAR
jgi:hypothetical protein